MKGWKKVAESKANKWSLKWFLFNGVSEGALVIYWLSYNGMYRNFSASFSFFLFSKHEQQLFWVVKANDPCIPGIFICGIRGIEIRLPFPKKNNWLLENLVKPVKTRYRCTKKFHKWTDIMYLSAPPPAWCVQPGKLRAPKHCCVL